MATIVTRSGKGSPLTSAELDQNQINLNTDKAELSGATFTGQIVAPSLDISGNIDVDGTTNLDVVDIDGAVDMASTLTVASTLAVASSVTSTSSNIIAGTGTDAIQTFRMGSGNSGANKASINFQNSASGEIFALDFDNSTGTFDISSDLSGKVASFGRSGGVTFNQDSNDYDFRVESDGHTHALFVDGGNNVVGIDTSSPSYLLDVGNSSSAPANGNVMRINSNGDTIFSLSRAGTSLFSMRNNGAFYTALCSNNSADLILGYGTTGAGAISDQLRFRATSTVFNEDGADRDFRVESDGNANMLFVDGGNNAVGIGESSPSSFGTFVVSASNPFIVAKSSSTSNAGYSMLVNGGSNGVGAISTDDGGHMTFDTGATGAAQVEKMRIQADGAVILKPSGITTGLRLQGRSSDNNFYIQWKSNDGGTTYGSIGTDSANTSLQYNTAIHDFNSANSSVNFLELKSTGAVFNEGGADADFRVESNNNANMLFVDGGNDRVGIGRAPVGVKLDILGGNGDQLKLDNSGERFTQQYWQHNGSPKGAIWVDSTDAQFEIYGYAGYGTTIHTNATERANFKSTGEVVFNDLSADYDFRVESDSNTHALFVDAGQGSVNFGTASTIPTSGIRFTALEDETKIEINHASGTGSGVAYATFKYNQSTVGSITQHGTSATLYNTSSDQRLKENIADADDAGSKIDAIQVRQFDWKADGSHQDYGMVAQELQTVAPEAVSAPENPDEMMGVDYSKLVPMLVKEIQTLRSRITALENA